jgi:arylsulfatase A-like enzyme
LRTGGHARNGIFIASGDAFRKAKLETVSILDVAPTVLALFGTEISSQMDGKVIKECLRPEILESLPMKIRNEEMDEKEQVLSEKELEEMKGVLRSLGYM